MDQAEAASAEMLSHYEGLVRKTSARYVGQTLHDFDDLCQIFRVKVWKALLAWNPKDPRIKKKIAKAVDEGKDPKRFEEELRDRFVFMCIRNQGKDLVKRRKPETDPLYLEDFTATNQKTGAHGEGGQNNGSSAFEAQYLSIEGEEIFGHLEDDLLLPKDLTKEERRVMVCLYLDYTQPEMALRLGITTKKVSLAMRSIREKMAEFKPSASADLLAVAA